MNIKVAVKWIISLKSLLKKGQNRGKFPMHRAAFRRFSPPIMMIFMIQNSLDFDHEALLYSDDLKQIMQHNSCI